MNAQLNKQGITDAWCPHPLLKSIYEKKQGVFCWAWPEVNPTKSMSWMPMTWVLVSPSLHQSWHWSRSTMILQYIPYIHGLAQDCSNSSALAMELLQSCAKKSISSGILWNVSQQPDIWCIMSTQLNQQGISDAWSPYSFLKSITWFSLHCSCHFKQWGGRKRLTRVRFPSLLWVSSDYAQPITGQVTEVTCPVTGRAQPELLWARDRKWAQIMTQNKSIFFFFEVT